LKETELNDLINDKVQKTVEEKTSEILATVGDDYIQDKLKEQLDDAVKSVKADVKVDPEIETAEEKAKDFNSFGEMLGTIRNYRKGNVRELDPRLTYLDSRGNVSKSVAKTAGHMEIGDDTQGGFLVPEIYRNELYMIALENAVVRPNGATVIKMTTDSVKIPYVDDTSHASTVFGGVNASWTAEAAQKTATKPTFGQMELTPHKLAGMTYSSDELLADSAIALQPLIYKMFGSAWGYYEDDAFINGTGAGQPLGILNCGCLKTVYRNTANMVYYQDLAEMYQSMLPSSLSHAKWVINPEVMAELLELGSGSSADASGKNLIYIDKAQDKPVWKIFGRPVIISEKMQGLGTAGDIGFFDFRYYLIGDRQPITIDASTHLRFDYDETAWRFVLRVAGQCWPQSTITSRYGGHTYSPFVVLHANTS